MTKLEAVLKYFPQIVEYRVFPHARKIFFFVDSTERTLAVKKKIRDYFGLWEYIRVFNPDNKPTYERLVARWALLEAELPHVFQEHPNLPLGDAVDIADERLRKKGIVFYRRATL